MTARRWTLIILFAFLALAVAGCAATVPQEDYDQVVADLDDALAEVTNLEAELAALEAELADTEAELVEAEANLAEAEAELIEAQDQAATAKQELATLQEKVQKAAISAEIMATFLEVGFGGGGDLTEEDAVSVFLGLSEQVEASGDEVLQEKFQAVLFSFGGEEEALDLVAYMLGTMSSLGE